MEAILSCKKAIKNITMVNNDGSSQYLETTEADRWLQMIISAINECMITTGINLSSEPIKVIGFSVTYMDDTNITLNESETDKFIRTMDYCCTMQQLRSDEVYSFPKWLTMK